MIKRTIEISSGPSRLSVARRQLVIETDDGQAAAVPIEDIGVVIVDHPAVTYTRSVFIDLLNAGAAVVLCSRDHHPAGVFLPIDAHSTQTERHHYQVEASLPFKKRAWAHIVRAKIARQADVIRKVVGKDEGLSEGEVSFVAITDHQFSKIRTFWGKKRRPPRPQPAQLEFF